MPNSGVTAATVRINDDVDAIARARHALCHQLRVLHNIRIRGPGTLHVAPHHPAPGVEGRAEAAKHGVQAKIIALDQGRPNQSATKGHHDATQGHGHQQPKPEIKNFDQQYYRVFHGEEEPGDFDDEEGQQDASRGSFSRNDSSQPLSRDSSRDQNGEGGDGQTLFSSFLWLLRDLLLLFCVIGVIYILLYCCCCNAPASVTPQVTTEGTFDANY